jgi:hypothetical protein
MIRITRERTFVGDAGFGDTVSLDAKEERWLVETGQAKYVKPVAPPEPVKPEPAPAPASESAGDADADVQGTGKKGRGKRRRVV